MLDELITEMGRRFTVLGGLPTSLCPEGKLTPEISRRYDLPIIFITIDELQEYLSAMNSAVREEAVDKLARLARRAPAAGFILNAASQRPDTDSVPAKLREIITYRYCTQVVDRTSSDMVLGKGKATQGADASILSEDHKGVGVLVTGPGSFEIVRCDYMDLPAFAKICAHGRALRIAAATLTGDAATDTVAAAEAAGVQIPAVLADVLYAMHGVERMHTTTLLARLVNMDDDAYGDFSPERLADELERAGVRRSGRQVKVEGVNLAGYRRADEECPGLRVEHPPVPIRHTTMRTAQHGAGRRRPPRPRRDLRRLILAVHHIFQQRPAVPAVARVITAAVRGHEDRHRPLLAQLQQVHPLPDPAAAPAALPDQQHLRTEPVTLQIGDQPVRTTPGLAGIPRRTDRLVPVGVLIQDPALLTGHPLVVCVLLAQGTGPAGTVQADPQVLPGPLTLLTLIKAICGDHEAESTSSKVPSWPSSSAVEFGNRRAGPCPVDHGTGSWSQLRIEATSMVAARRYAQP